MHFLERSARAFDDGFEAEAKRLAVVLRVLMHDTNQSHSLLKQHGIKDRLNFLDTAEPINPKNLLSTPGLVLMQITMTDQGPQGEYVAPLGDERPFPPRHAHFAQWWTAPVMKVDGTWSRKQLVLTLANQEGGAHVDPALNERYEQLAKHNGLGWIAGGGPQGGGSAFAGNAIAVAVRQITFEVLETFEREHKHFRD